MSKWIKLTDKTPEEKSQVLVYGNGHYCVCTYFGIDYWEKFIFIPYRADVNITNVTHWMLLPEGPNEH